ncbi:MULTISPECIES: cell division protein FtsZ [Bradyrhizobium]|jgi:cell division protein FtsZ|uniref:Cell division protein FtsZ n=1 Tax=Bradyrhizobium ottawaense TaxID=931866 RepID=A0ABV4FJ97_9BRAD|nr:MULTISPECIES: cell division protein FtsZ [Bradyrhizobium]MBR1289352.1 cell division protein FtsZ [Bradyrhizobium ottawaense]MBR1327033.1 cell division protein FtsZ [Bradyrhizobium ottawaense]MBR1331297.1 cell division protein FtsZ [Bradyrhizobium ottawaense]MBR1361844.1 cell division protein FtsZ [Bradyrhizobium ottawaense]MDA9419473.1 cell division protein FtsZ [Bradyrhizobium sp. CCBAU 25360]
MTISINVPDIHELKPRITVFGVGGAGGNAVNNMITAGLQGVDFVVANTDAQALTMSKAQRIVQMGTAVTQGLGAGSQPNVGAAAAEEVIDELRDHLSGANMVFVTAGMGGGTGTGAAPVIAKTARDMGILTVGVVTKPFHFEGGRRMRTAEAGINELHKVVDTLLIIPNQNLFRVANEKTTFADAFAMADQVLYSGVACITDLMVKEGLINLDFADVRAVMREMGKAMMGTGEASGDKRALTAAEAAIANPLIDDSSMKGAKGLLISITGGKDLTLFEVDEAATRIREEVDQDANIIVGATFDEALDGLIRVSVVATGIEQAAIARNSQATSAPVANAAPQAQQAPAVPAVAAESRLADLTARLRADNQRMAERAQKLEGQIPAAAPVAAAPMAPRPNVERAALAAIAAAVAEVPQAPAPMQTYGDVTVRPIAQKPTLFPEPDMAPVAMQEPMTPENFIPPQAERAPVRAPRMPRLDELPMPAQAEIRQARGEVEEETPQKTRLSLLQRLANVGLGRRDEESEPPVAARTAGPAMPPLPERRQQKTVAQQIASSEPVSEYARRPAPQGLDMHGRPAPVAPAPQGDDHLDIPAFLRRQAT